MHFLLFLLLGVLLPSTLAVPANFGFPAGSSLGPTDASANLTQPTLGIPSGPLDAGPTIMCRRPAPIPSVNLRTADCTNIIGRLNARGDFIIHPADNLKNFLMEGDIKRAGCRIKIAPDQHYHVRHVDLSLNQHKVYILYTTVMNKPCKEGGDMINFYDTARRINIAGLVFIICIGTTIDLWRMM